MQIGHNNPYPESDEYTEGRRNPRPFKHLGTLVFYYQNWPSEMLGVEWIRLRDAEEMWR